MSDQEHEHDAIDFADLDETYTEAVAPEGGSVDTLPDGNYEMAIANAYPAMSKSSNNRLFKWRMKVLGPRMVGASIWRSSTLEPDRIKWFKKDLQALGIEIDTLARLNDAAWIETNLKGLKVQCSVRNKDGYCNVYFNRAMGKVTLTDNAEDESGGFSSPASDSVIDDADIPF